MLERPGGEGPPGVQLGVAHRKMMLGNFLEPKGNLTFHFSAPSPNRLRGRQGFGVDARNRNNFLGYVLSS